MKNFKPMLAAAIKDTAKLPYPLIASPCLTWVDKTNLVVKYKYQLVGVKDKPRFPVYLGIRDWRDM